MNIRLIRGLRIAHLNVNRLVNKIDSIKELFSIYFDILALTETWLTPDITNDEIYISGYSIILRDRQNIVKSCGGGTLVFVRDSILFVVKSDLINNNTDFESIWLELRRPYCKRLTLCCTYSPGDQNIDEFIMYLDHCIGDMDLDNSEVVLTGDFSATFVIIVQKSVISMQKSVITVQKSVITVQKSIITV